MKERLGFLPCDQNDTYCQIDTNRPVKELHVATHLENREIREKSGKKFFYKKVREKSGKFMKNCKSQGKMNLGTDVQGKHRESAVYFAMYFVKFFGSLRSPYLFHAGTITFICKDNKIESGKKYFRPGKVREKSGKMKT